MTTFNIKIVSDTVCPWVRYTSNSPPLPPTPPRALLTTSQCYVGKKRLERAIEQHRKTVAGGAEDTFNITWHPFYLDPTAPAAGIPLRERMAQRFGAEAFAGMTARLATLGRAEGIEFRFDSRTGNTRDSHRLVQLGKARGGARGQDDVVSALFRLYFENDGDITSRDALVGAAAAAGLDPADARDWLDTGKGGAEVDREVEEAYAQGIHGVPNFTINEKYTVDGAQDAQVFLQYFAKIKAAEQPAPATTNGSENPSCAPGGQC